MAVSAWFFSQSVCWVSITLVNNGCWIVSNSGNSQKLIVLKTGLSEKFYAELFWRLELTTYDFKAWQFVVNLSMQIRQKAVKWFEYKNLTVNNLYSPIVYWTQNIQVQVPAESIHFVWLIKFEILIALQLFKLKSIGIHNSMKTKKQENTV